MRVSSLRVFSPACVCSCSCVLVALSFFLSPCFFPLLSFCSFCLSSVICHHPPLYRFSLALLWTCRCPGYFFCAFCRSPFVAAAPRDSICSVAVPCGLSASPPPSPRLQPVYVRTRVSHLSPRSCRFPLFPVCCRHCTATLLGTTPATPQLDAWLLNLPLVVICFPRPGSSCCRPSPPGWRGTLPHLPTPSIVCVDLLGTICYPLAVAVVRP